MIWSAEAVHTKLSFNKRWMTRQIFSGQQFLLSGELKRRATTHNVSKHWAKLKSFSESGRLRENLKRPVQIFFVFNAAAAVHGHP